MRLTGNFSDPDDAVPESVTAEGTHDEWRSAGQPPLDSFLGPGIEHDRAGNPVDTEQYELPADRQLINHIARKVEHIDVDEEALGEREKFIDWMRGTHK